MQPGLENVEKTNSFMNKTTFLKVHHSRHHSPRHHSRHSFETSQVSANLPGSQFFTSRASSLSCLFSSTPIYLRFFPLFPRADPVQS